MHQACDSRIPPRPRKLPRSATEAEKKHRSAVMKERKRCQAVVKNSDRVKMGGHGGHRENASRKIQDDVECDKVERSIRVGRPKYDLWRLDLFRNG